MRYAGASVAHILLIMEETLIIEVEKRPVLYDKTLIAYKNNNARERAWKEVAAELKLDVNVVKKRWRSLRDSFMKYHRAMKYKPSGSGAGNKKPWCYYSYMMFLIPHIEFKETIHSYTKKCEESKEENEEMVEEYQETEEMQQHASDDVTIENTPLLEKTSVAVETPSTSKSGRNKSREKVTKRVDTTDEKLLQIITKEADSDEQFLLSCLPILKRFDAKKNQLARIKIQQILYDIEFGNASNISHSQNYIIEERPVSQVSEYSSTTDNSVTSYMILSPHSDTQHTSWDIQ